MSFKFGTWELTKNGYGIGYEVIGFEKGNLQVRSSPLDRAFSHGSTDPADGKISGRKIRLQVRIVGLNEESYKKLEDNFLYHLYQEDWKFYPDANRYINVKRLVSADHSWENNTLFKTMGRWTVTLYCEDPFWYFGSYSKTFTPNSNPYDFDVFNVGTAPAFPIITITAVANLPSITLNNLTDNLLFTYTDANFVIGNSLVINSKTGTVLRNSINSIRFFTGSWPRFLKGLNNMRYTGAACTIGIAFTDGYL